MHQTVVLKNIPIPQILIKKSFLNNANSTYNELMSSLKLDSSQINTNNSNSFVIKSTLIIYHNN